MTAERENVASSGWWSGLWGRLSGLVLAAVFYTVLFWLPLPFLERYFLGHPVAIAATVLFCIALAQLGERFLGLWRARRQAALFGNEELVPAPLQPLLGTSDATVAADPQAAAEALREARAALPLSARLAIWRQHLEELPRAIRQTELVRRTGELIDRQTRRGHCDQLSEDMRDIADREADADHDALQFVRIIVWAIPMLGFLGTVIGITQTLGGLDFSDGAAAVERLKSGLYVAFDTTALGLILSVVAIFLQFPVEKFSRELLQSVDQRVGRLVPAVLAGGARIDEGDPAAALRQMTSEISATVRGAVRSQAELWREAIDEAQEHWRAAAHASSSQLQQALQETLGASLTDSLEQHASALRRVQHEGAEQIDQRWQQWQTALSDHARILLSHQKAILQQSEQLAASSARAGELAELQNRLDENVHSVDAALRSVDTGLSRLGESAVVTEAMMTLARAVEVLSERLPTTEPADPQPRSTRARRNAA